MSSGLNLQVSPMKRSKPPNPKFICEIIFAYRPVKGLRLVLNSARKTTLSKLDIGRTFVSSR
jgi:hypothetical protein